MVFMYHYRLDLLKGESFMPIYEYRCLDCGKTFEKIVPLNAGSTDCEGCHSLRVEKLFSAFAVQGSSSSEPFEPSSGCGTCGAPRPGMCRELD
jgi:putative FmdB family regulatory protein